MTENAEAKSAVAPVAESDEELMLAFGRGSTAAFETLFGRYAQPLFGFFRRRLSDSGQAEELTQEVFVVVLRFAPKYEPRALFRTYLYSIAFKILQGHRRKMAVRAALFGANVKTVEPAQIGADAEFVLRQAMQKLERTDREILMLREFEQLSYAEIAAILKLPVNTVRSRLFRARVALREILAASPAKVAARELASPEECI